MCDFLHAIFHMYNNMPYSKYFMLLDTREVKQNFLSKLLAADFHPNYFDIFSSLLEKFISNWRATLCVF